MIMDTTARRMGWTDGDGSGHDGYHYADYIQDGQYAGPDVTSGIEPVWPVEVSEDEDGTYVATVCGDYASGAIGQGASEAEALDSLRASIIEVLS